MTAMDMAARSHEQQLFFATEKGTVKKTPLAAYQNVRAAGIIAINIDEGDRLIGVELTGGKDDVLMVTRKGMGIRFNEEDARPMGRATGGVRGISLDDGDVVEGVEIVHEDAMLLTVTENGYGKRTDIDEYRVQSRGGLGIINIQTSDRNGVVVGALFVNADDQLMLMTQQGKILRTRVTAICPNRALSFKPDTQPSATASKVGGGPSIMVILSSISTSNCGMIP
jgi:DNA gyrase subunit A